MCVILSLCVVVDSALRERLNKIMASDYFTTSSKMKALTEVVDRRELKIRERREMVRKDIILGYILLQRYIILMSRIGK